MLILRSPQEMQAWSRHAYRHKIEIGFVPTMGALHQGHAELLQQSATDNSVSVLSIFVNPTQFNVAEDFEKYPRSFDDDVRIADQYGVDVVYAPSVEVMYPSGSSVTVQPGSAAVTMEGAMRPGHFAGVTTVVSKLFNAVLPHRAYFGKKDFQQLAVIKQMVSDLDFPVEIVGVETVREADGLAMSSRNVRLSPEHRVAARLISQGLFAARQLHASHVFTTATLVDTVIRKISETPYVRVEYVEVCDPITLRSVDNSSHGAVICVAAWFGDVRLIDNIELHPV